MTAETMTTAINVLQWSISVPLWFGLLSGVKTLHKTVRLFGPIIVLVEVVAAAIHLAVGSIGYAVIDALSAVVYYWWWKTLGGDDEWKKRLKKLAEKVLVGDGKLQVVPVKTGG